MVTQHAMQFLRHVCAKVMIFNQDRTQAQQPHKADCIRRTQRHKYCTSEKKYGGIMKGLDNSIQPFDITT